jgi:plasmid stability protein
MWYTCKYVIHMSKMIQLRNVPDSLHRTLKSRAALEGMSLSDYLIREIRELASRPTLLEFREMLHQREPVTADFDSADLIRAERDSR